MGWRNPPGLISWVGLVIPHVGRALIGAEQRRLLPVSALLGARHVLALVGRLLAAA